MSKQQDLERLIIDYIREQILGSSAVELDLDENLFASGQIDSVGIMRLIAHLESALEIKIPPTDLVPDNFRTIRVMAEYLKSLAAA